MLRRAALVAADESPDGALRVGTEHLERALKELRQGAGDLTNAPLGAQGLESDPAPAQRSPTFPGSPVLGPIARVKCDRASPSVMNTRRPRLVGINHVALEVGDLDEALAFYGRIFELRLRGRIPGMAFIDAGDQFIALAEGRGQEPDPDRHFGLVVDDKAAVRAALDAAGADIVPSRGLDFRDPWGNLVQVVEYGDIQFTKTPEVLRAMGLGSLAAGDGGAGA